jgi:hypothetical protein
MRSASGPCVKGTLLLARMKYVQKVAPEKVAIVLASLPAADEHLLRSLLLPSSWYPLDLLRRFESSIVSVLQQGSRSEVLLDIGRATAALNLTGTQRGYVRDGDPHFLLERSSGIYACHFNVGSRTYEKIGERAGVVRTVKPFTDAKDACLITVGWLERAIEIAGARNARVVETQCAAKGAPHCEIVCEWT